MDELDTFISEIVDKKDLPGVTPDLKQGLIETMKLRLIDLIDQAIISALPDEKVHRFAELLDAEASDDDIHAFIADSGINQHEIVQSVLMNFKDEYLAQ